MSPDRENPSSLPPVGSRRPVIAIVVLSVLLRLGSAFYQGNGVEALPGVHDQVTYHTLATRVLEGHGFSFATNWWPATQAGSPTAHWSYLYTLYLVFVYLVFGTNPLVARIIQSLVVGVLHPWLCWRIGRRIFREQTGVVAALIAAVYGYFVYYSGALMTESFFIVAILWVMDTATAAASRESKLSRATWIYLGLGAGTAVLLRQLFLSFVPFLIVWLWYALGREHRKRKLVSGVLTLCIVLVLLIIPWTARNYFAFKRFVLLNTNAGFAFFWANHPIHGTNFIPILRDESASYGALIPRELLKLDEASLDRELLREGMRFVVQDPQRYLLLSLSRTREYFRFWPSVHSTLAGNLGRALSFGFFSPLMAIGIGVTLASCSKNQRPFDFRGFPCSSHLLLLVFVLMYTGMHLLSWSLIRYRLPADSVLILYAASGTIWVAERIPCIGRWSTGGQRFNRGTAKPKANIVKNRP